MRGRRHEHVPEAFGARLLLQFLDNRNHLPALAGLVLLPVDRHRGAHMLGHERFDAAEPFLLAIRHIEVHGAFPLTVAEIVGRHCLPAVPTPQESSCPRAAAAGVTSAEVDASNALTFHRSNYSFIQLFELQQRICRPLLGGMICRRTGPEPRSSKRPSGCTPTAASPT